MASGKIEVEGLDELIDKVNKLKDEMRGLISTLSKSITVQNETTEAAKKNGKSLSDLAKETKLLEAAEKTDYQLKKEILATNEKLIQGSIKLAKAQADVKKEQQLQIKINETEKGSREQLGAQLALNTMRLNKMSEEQRNATRYGLELTKQTSDLKDKINQLDKSVGNHTGSVGNYEIATKSIKQEIKELTMIIAQAKLSQNENTKEIIDAKQRLGELKDTMADVSNEAKVLGSDTKHIDMLVGSIKAIGAAGQVAEGSMALLGKENEDVAKSIQKMVAIQSVMSGVQEVANSLQKESAFMLGLNTAATKVSSIAQSTYTLAVGASTGALKAFRVALLATGIGAIIAGIAALVLNWDKLFGSISNSTDALNDYAKANQNVNEAEVASLDILKKKAKLQSDISEAEIKANEERLYQIDSEKNLAEAAFYDEKSNAKQREEMSLKLSELRKEESSLNQKNRLLEIDLQNQLSEENARFEAEEEERFKKKAEAQRKFAAENAEAQRKFAAENAKRLEEQQKYRDEIYKLGLSASENEDLEFKKRQKKAGLFTEKMLEYKKEEQQLLANLIVEHEANLTKIEEDEQKKRDEIKRNNWELVKEAQQEVWDENINAINDQYLKELEAAGANDLLIEEAKINHDLNLLNEEISHNLLLRGVAEQGSKERAEIDAKLNDAKVKLNEYTNNQIVSDTQKRIESEKAQYQNSLNIITAYADAVGSVFGNMVTGNQNAAKQAIKQIISMSITQLKGYALAQIGIATIGSFAQPDSILTFGATGATRALVLAGLITAASSAAEAGINSIMGFAKGTNDAPGGLAFVGEKGREVVTLPDGTKFMTPNTATLMNLPEHSKVTPNHLVQQELNNVAKNGNIIYKQDNQLMTELIKTIKNKKENHISIDKNGFRIAAKQGNNITTFLNDRYRC